MKNILRMKGLVIFVIKYNNNYNKQVRDHDHFTGKYMGSAHREYKTKFTYEKKLNVFFHNLRGYDGHFLIQEIAKFNKRISVIPNNTEKFLSFSVGNVVFKDSLQFLSCALDKLTNNLVKKEKAENNPNVFKHLSSEFKDEQLELLKKKGIFPYKFLNY